MQGAIDSLSNNSKISIADLEKVYGRKFRDAEDFLSTYKALLIDNIRHMYTGVKHMDANQVGEDTFAQILANMLISKIDKNSISFAD